MDEQAVRDHAQAYFDALLAGDIGRAAEELSSQLRSNLGPIVAMLPLPLTEASIESVETTATGYRAVLRLVGEGARSISRPGGRIATGGRRWWRRAESTRNQSRKARRPSPLRIRR